MILILIQILQTLKACSNKNEGMCLINENDSFFSIEINNELGYGYGFWSQYMSMSNSYDINSNEFPGADGLQLLMEKETQTQETRLLYYQQNDIYAEVKKIFLYKQLNGEMQKITEFTFNSLDYEGMWIYHSFAFLVPNKIQIILYNSNVIYFQNFLIDFQLKQKITLILGRPAEANIQNSVQIGYFLGRLSQPEVSQPAQFFFSEYDAQDYFLKKSEPSFYCDVQIYEKNILGDYIQSSPGLIMIESWVKLSFDSTLNVTASLFGIEFQVLRKNYAVYQKLLYLEHQVYQGWTKYATYNLGFYYLARDHYYDYLPEFITDNQYNILLKQEELLSRNSQNFQEWHFIQLVYGSSDLKPVVQLKISFINGFEVSRDSTEPIYSFYDRKLQIRAGSLFNNSQDGVSASTGLSKIYICLPTKPQLNEQCYHSCLDCDGPNINNCLSCLSNRYLDDRQCKCYLGFFENTEGVCVEFNDFYFNSQSSFVQANNQFYQFGMFPITVQDQTFYLQCPNYKKYQNEKDRNILYCIECLSNPEQFAIDLICQSDYIINIYGQYEIQQRDSKDIELYVLNQEQQYIILCPGCQQQCNPNINQNCYLITQFNTYFQCLQGYYYQQGQCILCNYTCKQCINYDKCTECYGLLILNQNTGQCTNCPNNCNLCDFDQSIQLYCKQCNDQYTLYQGQCLPCGQYCLICEHTYDDIKKEYYNRCLKCIDDSSYYLTIDAINCAVNTIQGCKYVIQFHKNLYLRDKYNTMKYEFQRLDQNSSLIQTYCALCEPQSLSLFSGKCESYDPSHSCLFQYEYEDIYEFQRQTLKQQCGLYAEQTYFDEEVQTMYFNDKMYTGCQSFIKNCHGCVSKYCFRCFAGFYAVIYNGYCQECPANFNCFSCAQQSKKYKNSFKIWYKIFHFFLIYDSFYSDVFGNESEDQFEVVCTECKQGYQLYEGSCIPNCPVNCEVCIIEEGQNKCVKCKTYTGKALSLYNGECIECPRYCSLCYPKTNQQLQTTNSYFNNDDLKSTTHTCLLLEQSLNYADYIYNSDYKQYFKSNSQQVDSNSISMSFNLYCDLDQFYKDLENNSNKELFLIQNVRIDQLLLTSSSQDYSNSIENNNIFAYFSAQQIQFYQLELVFQQNCTIEYHAFLKTILAQKVYFINQATITLNGNFNYLILNDNLEILNFNKIIIKNMNIVISKEQQYINLFSETKTQVIFNDVEVTSLVDSEFQFKLTNILSLNVQQFKLSDSSFSNVQSLFQLINCNGVISITISEFLIQETILSNTNLFSLDNINSKISFSIQHFSIMMSKLQTTSIIASQYEYELIISDLIIDQSTIINSQPLFKTNLIKNFVMSQGNIIGSLFQNTVLFQISENTFIENIYITDSLIKNSTFLLSDDLTLIKNVSLNRFQIANCTYDTQYSILFTSSAQVDSQIKLTNWSLNLLQLSSEVTISTYSLKPLIYLQANLIQLSTITVNRKSGITEFYLGQATQIKIVNMTISNADVFKSIITNLQCKRDFSYFQYMTVLYIERAQTISISYLYLSNLVVFDMPLIYISSIETSLMKRQDSIYVDNLIANGCIIQKTKTSNLISIFYVSSQQKITINFQNSIFKNNFYHSQNTESQSNSALALQLTTQQGEILIDQCYFESNYISQSQNSLISVIAAKMILSNTKFSNNNYFSQYFVKNIDWGYSGSVTLDALADYFPVQSLSGNGLLQTQSVILQNISITGGIAKQAGCFYLTQKSYGVISIMDSFFGNVTSKTKGGCLYIEDQGLSINTSIKNTVFQSIFTVSEGGGIYFKPKSEIASFNFTNLTITNVYSLLGAFINLQFSNYLTQKIYMEDCRIKYTLEGTASFIHQLGAIDAAQKNELIASTAIITINYGQVTLKNVLAQLYIIALLESKYSNKVSLTSLSIDNSHYSSKPALTISCSLDEKCVVNLDQLEIKQFSFYQTKEYEITTTVNNEIPLSFYCQQSLIVKESEVQTINLDISQYGEDNIPQLILITQIKSNDQISIKNSYISQNECQGCQNGLIQLNFKEQIAISTNFQLKNIQISNNNCGNNGCLTFLFEQNTSTRLLSQTQYQMIINKLICNGNQAQNGGCIYSQGIGLLISNSIINNNNAKQFGGGIYYQGDVMNLLLNDNLIINNNAISGSALFVQDNSLPELNKTNNYLQSDQQTLQSYPSSLTITLNNYQNILFNYHKTINQGYLSLTQYSNNEVIITLPSGQEISQYQYFNMTNQVYLPLNLTFRIIPLNDYQERIVNLTNTQCIIQSGYQFNNSIVLTNNYTNYNTKEFNQSTQDYNFDDLIIYYGANNRLGYLILLFQCNSIKIPIYEQEYPYQISNYVTNYSLQVTIQTYKCQLGEYKDINDDSCHLCDISKKQYSVQYGAISCRFMDEQTTLQITPAQIKLKNGYWRPYINNEIIEKCTNKMENCQGGWKQGDETCSLGQIGARCEACDSYNLRGEGYFSQKSLYTCAECEEIGKQVLYIIATSIWMLISLNLTTKGIETMIMEIQKNKVGKIQLIINHNKQTGPYIKMFTNYLQNIAIILNFNVELPNALKTYFTIFGNPSQQLLISTDCFMAQQFTENIMYVKIIQCLINPIIYGLIYLFIYFLLVTFNQVQYNKIVITTVILYLFCYFSPQAIQLLIQSLSYQTISGIDWIQANLAYRFNTSEHIAWIPYFLVLIIILGFLIPALLLFKLFAHKKELYISQLRKNWGFLILEYQPKAFYWEFIRILIRELIIIAITFYQDNIVLKCTLVFSIMLFYEQGTSFIQPFKTPTLNKLDINSSLSCLVSIMIIFSLTQSSKLYVIQLAIIILPNGLLFLSFISSLFRSYLQAYEEIIDKIKDAMKNKFPLQIERSSFLKKLLISKNERRKIIRARFSKIRNHLLKTISLRESQRGSGVASKFIRYKFVLPSSQLFTSNSDVKSGKQIFLLKH